MPPLFRILGFFLVSFLAGGSLVAAFAPLEWWLLAFISPAILVVLWLSAPPSRAFGLGYFFGLGFFGVGVSWVYNSIHEFGHAPVPLAILLTFLFVFLLSFFPAAVGWLQAKCLHREMRLLVVIPGVWVLLESVRGWVFTGFPWLQLGYTQLDTPLASLAPVLGVLGISWVILLLIGLFLVLVLGGDKLRGWALSGMVAVFVMLLILGKIEWTQVKNKPVSVALVQGNISQENKWRDDWLLPTINRYTELTLKNLDHDLVIWPEVALPGFYGYFKPTVLDSLQTQLRETQTDLLAGILFNENGSTHNSLLKLGKDTEVYHKRHLVPFGEYIPLRYLFHWLNRWIVLPASNMDPGFQPTLLHVADEVIAGSICYEDAYGSEMAEMLPTAGLLVNVSNDAWFGDSLAPHQHLQIARMRALELGRPMLRATNTGISAIVDYKGGIIAESPQFEIDVLTAKVWPRAGATPYVRWGNIPALVLSIGFILVAFRKRLFGFTLRFLVSKR